MTNLSLEDLIPPLNTGCQKRKAYFISNFTYIDNPVISFVDI